MPRNPTIVSPKQERIAALAKQSPQMALTSLAYLMDLDWLKEAYRRTRKDGAVGVDGMTADEYEQDLEGNLMSLLDRAKSGTYHAPPVRRVHIPKGLVSVIKYKKTAGAPKGTKRRGRPTKKAQPASSELSASDLIAAKQLADSLGGVQQVRTALELLEKLG